MKAKELLNRDAVTIGRNDTLAQAKQHMRDNDVRHLVVLEDAAGCDPVVSGILSERDLFQAGMSTLVASGQKAQDAFLETGLVKEAMSTNIISAKPDTEVSECARIMFEHKIGCLPVLEGEALLGVISRTDLIKIMSKS